MELYFIFKKRALWPSFFVCLGLLSCLAVAASYDYLGLWLGLCCLFTAWVISTATEKKYSLPALGLVFLLILILFNLLLINPHALPIAYFVPAYYFSGFIVCSVLKKNQLVSIFRSIVILFCLLSCWAVVQYIFSYGQITYQGSPASTIFANPNTYAAAINLILLPLMVLYVFNKHTKLNRLYIVIVFLFASLITTQSRGGWVAFIIGSIFLLGLLKFVAHDFKLIYWRRLLYGFIFIIIILTGTKILVSSLSETKVTEEQVNIEVLKDNFDAAVPYNVKNSIEQRIDLAVQAWKTIKEKPFTGIGYYNYIYFYYANLKYSYTHYVHNDYLQFWVELGLLGLLAVLFIIGTSYWQGIGKFNEFMEEDRVWVIAILSALTAFFTHALVSYVFYVPLLVCLFAGYIAVLNSILVKNNETIAVNLEKFNYIKQSTDQKVWFGRSIISFVILIYLFGFVFAQISFRAGTSMLQGGNIDQALTLFQWARAFSPTEVNNYLVEAHYWKNSALKDRNQAAADRADSLYEEVMRLDSHNDESRLHRAVLHRNGNMLLSAPVSKETIIAWFLEALEWHPHHHVIQAEYIRTLKLYGRGDEARMLLIKYLKLYPDSKMLNNISEEILP